MGVSFSALKDQGRSWLAGFSTGHRGYAFWRKISLVLMLLLLTLALFKPHLMLPNRVYDWYFVVDITQSMNVPDYQMGGKSVSRLQVVRFGFGG